MENDIDTTQKDNTPSTIYIYKSLGLIEVCNSDQEELFNFKFKVCDLKNKKHKVIVGNIVNIK